MKKLALIIVTAAALYAAPAFAQFYPGQPVVVIVQPPTPTMPTPPKPCIPGAGEYGGC